MNNPLNATDPSGYFVSLIVGAVLLAAKVELVIVAIAVGITAAVTTLVMGGNLGDALIAGISAAALTFVGAGGVDFGTSSLAFLGKAAAMGTIGGITSTLQGGKFGHGFLSASVGSLVGSSGVGGSTFAGRALVGAISGGTISKATGGKFANGAKSGAFSSVLSSIGAKIGASAASGNASVGSANTERGAQHSESSATAAANAQIASGVQVSLTETIVTGSRGMALQRAAQGLSNVIPVPSNSGRRNARIASSIAPANYSSSVALSVGPAGYGSASGTAFGAADTAAAIRAGGLQELHDNLEYIGAGTVVAPFVIYGAAAGSAAAGSATAAWAGNTFKLTVAPRMLAWYIGEGVTSLSGVGAPIAAGGAGELGAIAGITKVVSTGTAVTATGVSTYHLAK